VTGHGRALVRVAVQTQIHEKGVTTGTVIRQQTRRRFSGGS